MSHFNASKLEEAVSACYEAASQPHLWPAALEVLAGATGAEGVTLIDHRLDSGIGYVCTKSFDEHMDVFVRENWSSRNYRFDRGISVAHRNGVVTEGMIFGTRELEREPLQAEFLERFKLKWFAGLEILSEPDANMLVSIDRRANSEPFSRNEVSLLRRALPHIRRAGQLALASSSSVSSSMLWGLNEFGRPALLLDGGGSVIEVNERAERLLGNGIKIVKSRLVASSRDANVAFQKLINSGLDIFRGQVPGPVALPRSSLYPLIAHIAPIVKSAGENFFRRAKALVMFIDPEQKRAPPATVLERAFGLTPAESRVALSIADGEQLRRIADANGIAFETARVHLKAVFSKTRTHSQVELAVLINRLAF
jgi:DNA-binding CsgD family transcriptional regulator